MSENAIITSMKIHQSSAEETTGNAFSSIWHALGREAGVAAEHLAIGVTALGRANYAQKAYYGQAFFALTTGFERSAKLALVVDHALEHSGAFPNNRHIRDYGHDLRQLLDRLDDVAKRRTPDDEDSGLPRAAIHKAIIQVLSDFATNVTRYFNLDLVTGAVRRDDPIKAWHRSVTTPILEAHYKKRHRIRHERNAQMIEQLLGDHALVRHHSEADAPLYSLSEASQQTAMTDFARPYARMYVMQIARFIARLMADLTYDSYRKQQEDIPDLTEFFAIFNNKDRYFRSRKTWSIYLR